MNYASINECFGRFIWSLLRLANVISRWDGLAVSVSSKLLSEQKIEQKTRKIIFFHLQKPFSFFTHTRAYVQWHQ